MSYLNKFMVLLVVIFIVFAFAQSEIKACPPGYVRDSVEVDIGTCHIKAYFCYLCQEIDPGLDIQKIEYLIPDECIDDLDVFKSQMKDEVYHEILLKLMLIPLCIKPCDDPMYDVFFTRISEIECKKLVNDIPNECFHLVECDEAYSKCVYLYALCVEIVNGDPVLTAVPITSWMDQTETCPNNTFPEIPLYPTNGWESDCFFFDYCGFTF